MTRKQKLSNKYQRNQPVDVSHVMFPTGKILLMSFKMRILQQGIEDLSINHMACMELFS